MRAALVSIMTLLIFPLTVGAQLTRQANTTLTLPADLPAATGYTTTNAFPTLSYNNAGAMLTAFVPGETHRLFVVERTGGIQVLTNLTTTPARAGYFNLTSILAAGETLRTDGENGFLSFAFHPQFATNGTFFVYYSMQVVEGANTRLFQRLHKVVVSDPTATPAAIASHTPLLTILDRATNHNGGNIQFGNDGYLYLSLGDEGNANDSFNNSRFINKNFWGHLIRLDVDNLPGNLAPNAFSQASTTFPSAIHPGTYKVPADNPFIGFTSWHNVAITPSSVRTEIWATGLRNPFRWSFDTPTGRLFLADVGQGAREEVNIVPKGGDMGWSWREGFIPFTSGPAPVNPPAQGFNPVSPIFDYDRTNDGAGSGNDAIITGTSITGGMVYRSGALTELFGKYIFADYNSGHVVALTEGPGGAWTGQRLVTDSGFVHFGVNPATGEMLIADLNSSSAPLKRIVRSGTSGTPPPALLSQTGAFSSLATLTPNAGIVPYSLNVPFWSDYAEKSRWFAIKNLTDTITFAADANWAFPAGMVWIKHFDIETVRGNPATKRKLETRFLVKTATDVYGITYRWRADQTDADLVAEDGLTELIPGSSPAQTWRYPSRTECRSCHTPVGGFALGFNTRQLNRDHTHGALTQNQITALSDAGYFSAPAGPVGHLPAHAAAADSTASLEHRVRSYLAVNCVQCHQPGGAATGNWDARAATPTDSAGIINGALVNNFGDPASRFLVPGDAPAFGQPTKSVALRRIRGDGIPRMPPLGTFERDLEAETLLTQWITTSLPARQSLAEWQTQHFGSPAAPNAGVDVDADNDGETNGLEFLRRTLPLTNGPPWDIGIATPGGMFELTFEHPANRGVIIETTTDFTAWSPWDVPGNTPLFPATDTPRTLIGPMDVPTRSFRARIFER